VQNCRTVRPYLLIRHSSQTFTLQKIVADGLFDSKLGK